MASHVPKTKQLDKPTQCCGVQTLWLMQNLGKYSCPCGQTKVSADLKRKR